MILKKLDSEFLKHIDDEFLEGDRNIDDETFEEHLENTDIDVDLDRLEEICERAKSEYGGDGDKLQDMDADIAPEIHKALDLTRREASDPEIWNYISLVLHPDFVRHRWSSCARKRFDATINLKRQAFSRLWWIAELTERDGEYELTEIAFSKQDIAQNIFDNNFSHFEPLLEPALKKLDDEPSEVAKKYGEILNRRFAVRLLETLDEDDLEELAEDVRLRAREEAGYEVEGGEKTFSQRIMSLLE